MLVLPEETAARIQRRCDVYRSSVCVYNDVSTGKAYALHPDYVDVDGYASMCSSCVRTITVYRKIPRYSIRAGLDMGRRPAHLKDLTLGEKLVIARARLYVTVIKVTPAAGPPTRTGGLGAVKFAKHTIVFPHNAPEVVCGALPRLSVDASMLSIIFVGSSEQFDALRQVPARGGKSKLESLVGGLIRVRADVVFDWLEWLRVVNPGYSGMNIAPRTPEACAALNQIEQTVLDAASLVDNATAVQLEEQLCGPEADIAGARRAEDPDHRDAEQASESPDGADGSSCGDDTDDCDGDVEHRAPPPGGSSLVYRTGSAAGAAVAGNPNAAFLRAVERSVAADGDAAAASDDVSAAANPGPADGEGGAQHLPRLVSSRESAPINEFTDNADLYYDAFPDVFPLRKGLPERCNGSLAIAFTRHLLLQASRQVAHDARLLYTMFNQLQRAAAARAASAVVSADTESSAAFIAMVNDSGFMDRMRRAIEDPTSPDAFQLVQQLQRFLRVTTGRVPYSPQQRELSLSHIIAIMMMTQHFGMPAWFVTIAPADLHHPLVWRLAVGLDPPSDLRSFCEANGASAQRRAVVTQYRTHVQRILRERRRGSLVRRHGPPVTTDETNAAASAVLDDAAASHRLYLDVPSFRQRAQCLERNGVAPALFYGMLMEALFTHLVGMAPNHRVRSTTGRGDVGAAGGVFGSPLVFYSVTEEQGRGAAHAHFVVWVRDLSPARFQQVVDRPDDVRELAAKLDACVRAWTPVTTQLVRGQPRRPGAGVGAAGVGGVHSGARDDVGDRVGGGGGGGGGGGVQQRREEQQQQPPQQQQQQQQRRRAAPVQWRPVPIPVPGHSPSCEAFWDCVSDAVLAANIHKHTSTCRHGGIGKCMCRVAMPRPSWNCLTCPIQLSLDLPPSHLPTVMDFIEAPSVNDELAQAMWPFPATDRRVITWRLCSPSVGVTWAEMEAAYDAHLLHVKAVLQRGPADGGHDAAVGASGESAAWVHQLTRGRKASWNMDVVPYSPIIMAATGSNNTVYPLFNESAAVASANYIAKYLSKDKQRLEKSLPLIYDARRHVAKYPSTAADTGPGTDVRTAKHVLTRCANSLTGLKEVSLTTVALCLLGFPHEFSSHSFWYVFVRPAVAAVRRSIRQRHGGGGGGGCGVDDEDDDSITGGDSECVAGSDGGDGAAGYTTDAMDMIGGGAQLPNVSDDMRRGLAAERVAAVFADDVVSDEGDQDLAAMAGDIAERTSAHGSATIYTAADGRKISVAQHEHYRWRGRPSVTCATTSGVPLLSS